jgi:O-antigen/teichoic acid export membrane protein
MAAETPQNVLAADQLHRAPDDSRATRAPEPAAVAGELARAIPNEDNQLYRRSSHFLGGQIVLFLLGFVSFPILARIFSVAEYGLIALVLNTISVAAVLSKFGLQHSVQRFYKEKAISPVPGALRRYYSSLFLGGGGIGLAVTTLFLLGLWLVPAKLLGTHLHQLLGYASALIFIRATASIINSLLQVEGNTKAFNVLQLSTRAATVAVTVLLLLTWKATPSVFFLGMIVVEAAAVLVMLPYLRRRRVLAAADFHLEALKVSLAFGFPMMITEICYLLLDSGDRFLVQGYLGAQALGYYAAAYNISGYVRDSLANPLGLAFFPLCMELWVTKGKEETQAFISRSMDHFVLAGVGLVCAVSVTSRDAINILASPKFSEAHRLLPFLLIGLLVSSLAMFLKVALLIHRRTLIMVRVVFVACLVNVAMNVILLPRIGLLGAAIATLVSYALMTGLFAWESLKLLPLRIEWVAWGRYALVGLGSWAVVTQFSIENVFVDLAAKGTLCLTLYLGTLCLLDAKVRSLTATLFRVLTGRRRASPLPNLSPAGKS